MKKTIGFLICTLLISISFVPIGNAINVGDPSFFEDTAELDVEVTWETYKVDGQWYVKFICDSAEMIERIDFYFDDEFINMVSNPILPHVFHIEWYTAMRFFTFKFVFYGFGGETATVIVDGSDVAPLEGRVHVESYKVDGQWIVNFYCDSFEPLDRLEMYVNDELLKTVSNPILPHVFTIEGSKAVKSYIYKFVFYGFGGETDDVIIYVSDIIAGSQQSLTPHSSEFIQNTGMTNR